MEQALEILRDTFGYRDYRGDQQEIINHILTGNDALVLMPTGGGKSLCYQVPAHDPSRHGHHHLTPHCPDAGPGQRLVTARDQGLLPQFNPAGASSLGD